MARLSESQLHQQAQEINEPTSEVVEFDFATERQLKTILLPTQTILALHGPDSPEFQLASEQARQQLQHSGIQPADTRLTATMSFLLDPDSPLRHR